MLPEVIRIRGERELSGAMVRAAARERTSAAEWARRKLLENGGKGLGMFMTNTAWAPIRRTWLTR
jgi:hypothetical protein